MVEDHDFQEVTPPPVELELTPRDIVSQLIGGVMRPEDIADDKTAVILELETMLPLVHGGIRGTVLELIRRLREEDEEEEEPA